MRRISLFFFIAIAASFAVTSCVKEKSFPPEPKIEFKNFISYNVDSADCIINFTDGDGDIGIAEGDTASKDDLTMKYLYLDTLTGNYLPYDYTPGTGGFDTLFYGYRVPDVTPKGQYKALDGEIKARLRSLPLYNPVHKKVKFEIQLRDRAGHLSNKVMTNEIVVPH
jgi:hypothetical protein